MAFLSGRRRNSSRRKAGPRLARAALAGVALLLPSTLSLMGTGATTVAPGPATARYATAQDVCRSEDHSGQASCLAVRRVAATASTPGAVRLRAAEATVPLGPAGGLTPADLSSAYSYSPTATGSGQTVAVIDAYNDPDIVADLGVFDSQYGLAPCSAANGCLSVVNQEGGQSLPNDDTSGWSTEEALDVETVHAVCESCKVLLVEANSDADTDLAQAVDEAIALGATEVSNSYGESELDATPSTEAAYDHPGTVITAAAGDDGYYSYDELDGVDAPDVPAAYSSVVAVGGTSLDLQADGQRASEVVWDDNGPEDVNQEEYGQPAGATGGGCSTEFPAPSWQLSVGDWASTGCGDNRLASDVSADGDYLTGLDIYDSYDCGADCDTGWQTLGGTSLSSVIVASMFALAGGAQGTSYPAQTLYSHLGTSALYDVVDGGDGWCDGDSAELCGDPNEQGYGVVDCDYTSTGSLSTGNGACDSGPGYDGPSGVGTPNGIGAFLPVGRPPMVTGLGPGAGTTIGGTMVVITGADLSGASAVRFGSQAASSFSVVNDGEITAVSPAEPTGTVEVTVTTPAGTSAATPADEYTFTPSPATTTSGPPTTTTTTSGPPTTTTTTGPGNTTTTSMSLPMSTTSTAVTTSVPPSTSTTSAPPGGSSGGVGGGGAPPAPTTTTTTTAPATPGLTTTTVSTSTTVPNLVLPPGTPVGTYTTPLVTMVGADGARLNESAGGATVTVQVPPGALPSGTELGIAWAANSSALKDRVRTGQAYLLSFSVSWAVPGGSSPPASAPLALTVADPSLKAGDIIYMLHGGGLKAVGTAAKNGRATVAFSTDPDFVVTRVPTLTGIGGRASLQKTTVGVKFTCGPAITCSGSTTVSLRQGTGKAARTLLLASGHFSLDAATTKTVLLPKTPAGLKLPKEKAHGRTAKITVQLTGGKRLTQPVTLG